MPLTGELLRLLAAVNARRDEDVSLGAMAGLAHRSRYDLHRAFRRGVGETPKEYTSRVRLSRAAADLVSAGRPVTEVALAHGYSGHEVFARAFTRRLGLGPRAYRVRGLHVPGAEALHALTVADVAPCVGLYRTTTTPQESRAMPAEPTVTDMPPIHALALRRRVGRDEIAATLGQLLPVVFAYAQRSGLAMAGPPFTRYLEVGMGSIVLEAAVHLAGPVPGEHEDGIEALTIPAGPAVVAVHQGPYERLTDTYREIEAWLDREGRKPAGPPRETYLTDPGENPDPETWRTQIAWPVT